MMHNHICKCSSDKIIINVTNSETKNVKHKNVIGVDVGS